MSSTESAPLHDVIVLSDLHLGRGKNPETGRYHGLETFFYDEDFRRFCRWLVADSAASGRPLRVVLNGDVFDLLRIEPDEAPPEASRRERRWGVEVDAQAAARLVTQILEGHPVFVDGIALLVEGGVEVVFLPGNHDIELQWAPVQEVLRRAVLERVRSRAGGVEAAGARLRFSSWFYYEPGRLWVEHGCQYDPENAFRFPLRGGLVASPSAGADAERDLPLGNFFQRYLYNAFGPITFIVPTTRANSRYFKWLLANQPSLLVRVARSHGPFVAQVVRRLARNAVGGREALARAHQEELAELARSSGLDDRLYQIDALKTISHDVVQAVRELLWQTARLAGIGALTTMLLLGLWFAGFSTINELRVGFGPKGLLFLALNFFLLAGVAVGIGIAVFRGPPPVPPTPLWRAARQIAGLVDVPIVTFGHTHDEALWRADRPSGERAWYYNTGTWIAVFTGDVLLPRERVQFTFLRVRGYEAELLHWSPGRGEPMPVVLLDEDGPWMTPAHRPGIPEA